MQNPNISAISRVLFPRSYSCNIRSRTATGMAFICRRASHALHQMYSYIFNGNALACAYAQQRPRFIQKANALFDPKEQAFRGKFVPWPIGHPTLFGNFDPQTANRISTTLGLESGSISSNGMTLTLYPSEGTFVVRGN